jgi:hypothetical protein
MVRLILEVTSGPQAGKTIEVESGQVVRFGRTTKADVATYDSYMSGLHFAVECQDEVCLVRDLNSRNGTLLNGTKVGDAPLANGDHIQAGQTVLVARLASAGAVTTPPPVPPELQDTIPPEMPWRADDLPPTQREFAPPAPQPEPPAPTVGVQPPVVERARPSSRFEPTTDPQQVPVREPPPAPTPARLPEQPAIQQYEPRVRRALTSSLAATPEGRLMKMLCTQPETLYGLLDAASEPNVPDLLRQSGEVYQSLYESSAYDSTAPYLVRFAPDSRFLEKLAREAWGKGWVVFLTCSFDLPAIRNYFRHNLMVKLPDGREFFSRFYDPRFFRNFLRGATPAEAERYFGPISRYLMESENPDILLQFTKTARGAEMKERLLLIDGT